MGITTSMVENNKISNEFEFIFEKGEHTGEKYVTTINVPCNNPTCNCSRMEITTYDSGKQLHEFYFDVRKKAIDIEDVSTSDLYFGKAFLSELKEEDWNNFYKYFYSYKSKLTKNLDIDNLKVSFAHLDIKGGETVPYSEIFPFSEQIIVTQGSSSFLVDDQYCLNPKCDCTHSILCFVEFEESTQIRGKEPFVAQFDYEKKSVSVLEVGFYKNGQIYATIDKLKSKYKNIWDITKERHSVLKKLYHNRKK